MSTPAELEIRPGLAAALAERFHIRAEDVTVSRKSLLADIELSPKEPRTVVARVSTKARDRDGEVILPGGIALDEFRSNPVLCWQHDYKIPAIGKALWIKATDDGLLAKFQFAKSAFSTELLELVREGVLRAFSIGFVPIEFDKATRTFTKILLLEVSLVNIPANPEALVIAVSEKGLHLSAETATALGLNSIAGGDSMPPSNTPSPAEGPGAPDSTEAHGEPAPRAPSALDEEIEITDIEPEPESAASVQPAAPEEESPGETEKAPGLDLVIDEFLARPDVRAGIKDRLSEFLADLDDPDAAEAYGKDFLEIEKPDEAEPGGGDDELRGAAEVLAGYGLTEYRKAYGEDPPEGAALDSALAVMGYVRERLEERKARRDGEAAGRLVGIYMKRLTAAGLIDMKEQIDEAEEIAIARLQGRVI